MWRQINFYDKNELDKVCFNIDKIISDLKSQQTPSDDKFVDEWLLS